MRSHRKFILTISSTAERISHYAKAGCLSFYLLALALFSVNAFAQSGKGLYAKAGCLSFYYIFIFSEIFINTHFIFCVAFFLKRLEQNTSNFVWKKQFFLTKNSSATEMFL